jgi:toxin YoeB
MLQLVLASEALEDLQWLYRYKPKLYVRVKVLIDSALVSPFTGIGKPEPLKFALSGCWSRRIDREHRLVYRVEEGNLVVLQCRYHY